MKKVSFRNLKTQVAFLSIVSLILSGLSFFAVGEPLPNQPPVAEIVSIEPNPAFIGQQVNFTGGGFDPENGTKYFSWDFNGDGTWEIFDDPIGGNGWKYHYANYTYSSPGVYNVSFRVRDVAEEYDIDTAVVEILNLAPTVEINYPTEDETLDGIVLITGTAADLDSNVTLVEIKINEGNWSAANGTNNWEYVWNTHIVGEGNHTIYARSQDNFGSYSEEDTVNVIVKFIPDLQCTGTLSWTSVKPGTTVTGSFDVQNVGEIGSKLDWEVVSWPNWGTWTFEPSSGEDLTPEAGSVTLGVTVVAPTQWYSTFTGDIKIVNKDNTNDYEIISVSLATPRSRFLTGSMIHQLYNRMIVCFPALAKLLGIN